MCLNFDAKKVIRKQFCNSFINLPTLHWSDQLFAHTTRVGCLSRKPKLNVTSLIARVADFQQAINPVMTYDYTIYILDISHNEIKGDRETISSSQALVIKNWCKSVEAINSELNPT